MTHRPHPPKSLQLTCRGSPALIEGTSSAHSERRISALHRTKLIAPVPRTWPISFTDFSRLQRKNCRTDLQKSRLPQVADGRWRSTLHKTPSTRPTGKSKNKTFPSSTIPVQTNDCP